MNRKMDFWVIVGLLVVLMGFMLSMNARMGNMATKADLARVEADVREIRGLIVSHIERET